MTAAENALSSNNYNTISQYFDIDSMVNFYITLEFFKNIDVNTSSTRFHIKDGKIYGGPVWDFDLSSGNGNDDYYYDYNKYTDNNINENKSYEDLWATNVPWFYRLMKNSTFQSLVKERYLELQDDIVNLYADNINGQNRIDYSLDTYEGTIARNHNEAGWRVDKVHHSSMQLERDPDKTYEEHIAFYRHWLEKRNEWLLEKWGLDSEVTAKNSKYSTLNGYFVENVKLGTTASQLLSDYNGAKLMHKGKELKGDDLVRNGAYLTVGGASYVMYIKGDVNGDGKITAMDYSLAKRAVIGSVILDETQKNAADVYKNNRIDVMDYSLLKRHVLGTYVIQ